MARDKRPQKPETTSWQEVSNERAKTPRKWNSPKDGRTYKGSGTYPNYTIVKGVCGDVWMHDRSMNNESFTWQGPDGQGWQFKYDGSSQFVAHNGHYTVIFGENRMIVQGAMDITARGGGSLRMEGDYNVTAQGDMNFSGKGKINMVAEGMNIAAGKEFNVASESSTMKSSKSTTIQSAGGAVAIAGDQGVAIGSKSGQVGIGAGGGPVSIGASGDVAIQGGGEVHIKGKGDVNLEGAQIHNNTQGKTKSIRDVESAKEVAPPEPMTNVEDIPMSLNIRISKYIQDIPNKTGSRKWKNLDLFISGMMERDDGSI